MNVALVVHSYDSSEGTGGYVVELLPRVARVHDVTLYAARVRSPVPAGVRVVKVPALMYRSYTAILSFPAAFRSVRRQHDLVHAQGWVTGHADVVTAHIIMAAWRAAAKAARVPTPPGERFLGGFVERREARLLAQGAGHVIAPSERARDDIARYYSRREGVTVVRHGFRTPLPLQETTDAADARRRLDLPEDSVLALFVGDIRKGLHTAIDAVAGVPEVQLAIVSHSSPADTIARARAAGVTERVHWLGSRTDVSLAFAAADLLVHPTIYDSFGLVVAEAMAHGIPAIVNATAGVTELITHRETGWIVEGNPLEGAVTALRELANDRDLRTAIGRRAREAAAQRTWDDVARETLDVYEKVTG